MQHKLLTRIYVAIAVFALVFLIGFGLEAWRNPSTGAYWHVAALIGSIIIAAGWIVTSENTVRNNARQHTITVILDYDKNPQHDRNWKIIVRYLPGADDVLGPPLTSGLPEDHELYSAVDAETDYLEFIALGVLNEVFDDVMIKSAFQVDVMTLYQTAKPYIDYTREEDVDVWDAFCRLAPEWDAKPPVAAPKMFATNLGEAVPEAGTPTANQ